MRQPKQCQGPILSEEDERRCWVDNRRSAAALPSSRMDLPILTNNLDAPLAGVRSTPGLYRMVFSKAGRVPRRPALCASVLHSLSGWVRHTDAEWYSFENTKPSPPNFRYWDLVIRNRRCQIAAEAFCICKAVKSYRSVSLFCRLVAPPLVSINRLVKVRIELRPETRHSVRTVCRTVG